MVHGMDAGPSSLLGTAWHHGRRDPGTTTTTEGKTGIKPGDLELACTHHTPGEVAPRTSANWVLGARIEEWSMDRGWGSIQHIS